LSLERRIFLLLGMLLLAESFSCTPPPLFYPPSWPSIPGILPGDSEERVVDVLGKPSGSVRGWWSDTYRFDMDYQIWLYKGVGRIIFDSWTRRVVATQADPGQTGSSIGG
jgi:hypothetical protein